MELAIGRGIGIRRRHQLIDAGGFFQQFRTLLEEGFHVVDRIAGTGDFVTRGIHIHHETRRRDADQHQHHQANAFLPIVSTVRERHANSRQDQRDTGPERRLFLTVFLFTLCGRQVDTRAFFGSAPVATQQENQAARDHQTDDRRDDKRSKNTDDFRDIQRINHGSTGHQRIG